MCGVAGLLMRMCGVAGLLMRRMCGVTGRDPVRIVPVLEHCATALPKIHDLKATAQQSLQITSIQGIDGK